MFQKKVINNKFFVENMENIDHLLNNEKLLKKTFISLNYKDPELIIYSLLERFKDLVDSKNAKSQYNSSEQSRKLLDNYMKDKIQLSKLNKLDLHQLKPLYFPKNSVIFINNSEFSEKNNKKLFNIINLVTASDVIIILSKLPNKLYNFKLIEKLSDKPKTFMLIKDNNDTYYK